MSSKEGNAPGEKPQAGGTRAQSQAAQEAAQEEGTATDPIQTEGVTRVGPVSGLDEIPEVARYLQRIGAEATQLYKARITEIDGHGYPKPVGWASFAKDDGTVTVSGTADAPTPEEQEGIAKGWKRVEFPKPVTLTAIAELPPKVNLSDRNVWVCHDFDGRIAMIHQRYDTEDGGKGFIPWTRWSDGQWRKMEPEVMPFFGAPGYRDKATLVIHEGAKAAAHMKRLKSGEISSDICPWWRELEHAHHIGWIGGVYAVDRSDWSRLAAHSWNRVFIIADNDEEGVKAARQIAGKFAGRVEIVMFDQQFPARFDLADEWPAEQFDDLRRFVGPTMRDCTVPATQATMKLPPPPDGGRPAVVIRDEFASQWAYIAEPLRIVPRANPSYLMRPETFNAITSPFSHVKDTATKLYDNLASQHAEMVYRPGFQPGTLAIDGLRKFNVYEGANIEPAPGDTALWLALLTHLFPIAEERELVMRWLATLIAKPRVRMRYGLLLISITQGVGKNTLGNVLQIMLGRRNVSFPSESAVVESDFNEWAARKRLIFLSEFYSGQKRKAYDKMKSLVADDEIKINEKNTNRYDLENWATVIACSNSEEALYLDDEDRRWLVPTVAEEPRPPEFWQEFYAWIHSDGPGAIMHWAEEFVAGGNYVRTTDHAPDSPRKRHIVEQSRSDGKKLAVALGEHLVSLSPDKKLVVRLADVRSWIAMQRGFKRSDGGPDTSDRRLEKAGTLTAALKKVPGITVWADLKRPNFGMVRDTVFLNFDPEPGAGWPEVREHFCEPDDLEEM